MDNKSLAHTRCVMFDLDGTLVDSAPDIAISLNEMLADLSIAPHSVAQVRDWMGNGASRLIKRALTGEFDGEPNETLFIQAQSLFFQSYENHISVESKVYAGVYEGLDALQDHGIKMAIVTNKPRRFTPALMQAFNLEKYFAYVVCGDDLAVKKPDPLALNSILQKEQLQPDQAIMVGDSSSDINAAQAAKMKSFCVDYGYNQLSAQGKGVEALGADYIISSIAEIPQYILI